MSSRIRPPATVTLAIFGGDTLTVKKHLNAGETRAMYEHMQRVGPEGETTIDPMKVGLSKVAAYLVDWTICDADNRPIVIRNQSRPFLIDAIDSLDPEDYAELLRVIDAHDDAMGLERRTEKNARDGEKALPVISPSLDGATGDTSGSEILM